MKLPAFQFYVGDWRKDPGVQALDYETRGIWFEMMCLMHESDERGVLLLNGKPMPDDALANLLRLDKQILTTALTKILDYGVASRREGDGAIYCRRMVRDENIRKVRAEAGKQGGNPLLLKQKPTTGDKQKPTPSSSASITSSSTDTLKAPKGARKRRVVDPEKEVSFAVFWNEWPQKVNRQAAREAWDKVDTDISIILRALENQKQSPKWAENRGQYIPHASTWLNGRRWEDEVSSGAEAELTGFTMVDPHNHE